MWNRRLAYYKKKLFARGEYELKISGYMSIKPNKLKIYDSIPKESVGPNG